MKTTRARRLGDYLQEQLGWIIWLDLDKKCPKNKDHEVDFTDNFCRVCGSNLSCKQDESLEAEIEEALKCALGE